MTPQFGRSDNNKSLGNASVVDRQYVKIHVLIGKVVESGTLLFVARMCGWSVACRELTLPLLDYSQFSQRQPKRLE